MSIPHKCPVCEGRGEVGKRLAQVGAILISGKPPRFRCHGCTGTGIVWDHTFQITPQPLPQQPFPGPTWISNGNCNGIVDPMNGRFDVGDLEAAPPFGDRMITDHICARLKNPPEECDYCGNTCGCPKKGPHSVECMMTWNPGPIDQISLDAIKDGNMCSCSPDGEPHSDNCKAASW